ncbi:unnamed protein product [Caenorhabditis auriculariae]|uniref:Sugar phosphate phosphatase n=1 Tax=Caenorhabditis auriculariae TaxID=2777116 RepID=A0A8S1HEB8_9PELO|nr:unnamed protein product [Caenorhabditis auriculariae]
MISEEDLDSNAPKLNGRKEGTFVFITIKDRWPKIVARLANDFCVKRAELLESYGESADEDIKAVNHGFAELRYRMTTDKPLENIVDNYGNAGVWNTLLINLRDKVGEDQVTWYRADWLFVECYLYRKIFSIVFNSRLLRDYDYFAEQKQSSFKEHVPQIEESASFLMSIVGEGAPAHETFGLVTMLKMCLWGNRADLSLSGGDRAVLAQSSMIASTKRENFILVDDLNTALLNYIYPLHKKEKGTRRIDIVLDNAGVELMGDLILAEYFLSMGFADKVVLHGKEFPYFVSDTTKGDFDWTLEQLKEAGENCAKLQERLAQRLEKGELVWNAHPFWTFPHAYFEMPTECPELYEELKKASFAFFKGDLNYRKLVGDRDWDFETPFVTTLRGFAPCPFLALRTLKAETLAGLSRETAIRVLDFEDNQWLVSGEYAVCQLGGI